MYVDPKGLGYYTISGTQRSLMDTAMNNGEAAFTWWNNTQPMAALPESPLSIVTNGFNHTWGMKKLSLSEALAQVLVEADNPDPTLAAISLQEAADIRHFATAARVEDVIMWALPGSNPEQSYRAWLHTRRRVQSLNWLDVPLPSPTHSHNVAVSNGARAAISLFWLRWEAGVEVAQGRFDDLTLRATTGMSVYDVIDQTQDR